jgi:hypothetical protein
MGKACVVHLLYQPGAFRIEDLQKTHVGATCIPTWIASFQPFLPMGHGAEPRRLVNTGYISLYINGFLATKQV